jgi:hypothetical protein
MKLSSRELVMLPDQTCNSFWLIASTAQSAISLSSFTKVGFAQI